MHDHSSSAYSGPISIIVFDYSSVVRNNEPTWMKIVVKGLPEFDVSIKTLYQSTKKISESYMKQEKNNRTTN